jgi:hypothetical protein
MIRNGGRYASLLLGAGALLWLAERGIHPPANPFEPDQYVIEDTIDKQTWEGLLSRTDVIFCLIWFFITAGPTATLPTDFNIADNHVNVIGNGSGGTGGLSGSASTAPGGSSASGC